MNPISLLAERLRPLGETTQLPKGSFLFGQGDPAKGVFVVGAGRACISLSGRDGAPVWSRIVGPGAILGLPSTVSGQPYTLAAVALEKVDAAFVTRQTLCELMSRDPELSNQVVRVLSEELGDLRRRISLMNATPGNCD
jgi:CRP/FNR family transcriptional regulator